MTDSWIRILALVCLFGAVILAVEVLVTTINNARTEGRAINLRLKMIGRGFSRGGIVACTVAAMSASAFYCWSGGSGLIFSFTICCV